MGMKQKYNNLTCKLLISQWEGMSIRWNIQSQNGPPVPKLMKLNNWKNHEIQKTSSRINPVKTILKHIFQIAKGKKSKIKKDSETFQRTRLIRHRRMVLKMTANFSSGAAEDRGPWTIIYKILEENKVKPGLYIPRKQPLKVRTKWRAFHWNTMWATLFSANCSTRNMEGLLQTQGKCDQIEV